MQPTELGRYRIIRVLGRGGMGVVYEGYDPQIERAVAIKTIALDALDEQEAAMFEARFRAEMRSAGRLQHQNIAALYDTGRYVGTAYIVMELVIGQDLKRRLATGERFDTAQALDIMVQLLAALEFAHRRQVIHRDVKPANVMLQGDGTVKLCDFGVARLADSDATRTQGMVVGSLRYASPEQISGLPIDARTDVFSAGVLLFELLTGELPFKGQSDVETLNRIATATAPRARSIRPSIPVDIDEALQRALARNPADRFGSAAEFARALGASSIASTDTVPWMPQVKSPQDLPAPAGQPSTLTVATPAAAARGHRWLVPAAGGVLAAAVVAGYALWPTPRPGGSAERPAAAPSPVQRLAAASEAGPAPAVTASSAVPELAPVAVVASAPIATPSASAASGTAAAPEASASSAVLPQPIAQKSPAASAAPSPKPARAAASPAVSAPVAARPADGAWHAQVACGAVLSTTAKPGSEAFTAHIAIEVNWPRIAWTRNTAAVAVAVAGSFDAQGRFKAEGQGSRKDRVEAWRERAEGEYVPKTQLIVGRVQVLRSRDDSVARECTFAAAKGAKPEPGSVTAPAVATSSAAATRPPATTLPQGAWDGRLSCGASQSATAKTPESNAFVTPMTIEVAGRRITMARNDAKVTENTAGSVDERGRFNADGKGSYKNGRGDWRVQARGEYLPKPGRIEARVQLLRADDGSLARDCTLAAEPAVNRKAGLR